VNVPRLHVICTDDVLAREAFPGQAEEILAEGAGDVALHLRPRAVPVRSCLPWMPPLVRAATRSGGWLVVNGRVDLAVVGGAGAVQLGGGALPPSAVRRVVPVDVRIGVSVHGIDDARVAAEGGADYLLVGTIFPTPSHPGEPGVGVAAIEACAGIGLPVIAIGGIDAERLPAVLRAGAHGVAVIRAVWETDSPPAASVRLRRRIETLSEGGR
jgi:thiamine-phosphate pyrophosphorylase